MSKFCKPQRVLTAFKSPIPRFSETVKQLDLVSLMETKIMLSRFLGIIRMNSLESKNILRNSGDIFVYFKEALSKSNRKIDTDSDFILWMELDNECLKLDENEIFGVVYIPPENSTLYSDNEITLLERDNIIL